MFIIDRVHCESEHLLSVVLENIDKKKKLSDFLVNNVCNKSDKMANLKRHMERFMGRQLVQSKELFKF